MAGRFGNQTAMIVDNCCTSTAAHKRSGTKTLAPNLLFSSNSYIHNKCAYYRYFQLFTERYYGKCRESPIDVNEDIVARLQKHNATISNAMEHLK